MKLAAAIVLALVPAWAQLAKPALAPAAAGVHQAQFGPGLFGLYQYLPERFLTLPYGSMCRQR